MVIPKKILSILFPITLGGLAGFAYWYFIGCSTGNCPITSHWYISTGYGILAGSTFLFPKRSKQNMN